MTKIVLALKLLPYMAKYWRMSIIAGLCTVIWYQNNSMELYWDIDTLPYVESKLKSSEDNLKISIDGNATLTNAITQRNQEITQWQSTTLELENQNKILLSQISDVQQRTSIKVKNLLKQKTPQSCTAAFELLSNNTGQLTWDD